MEGPGGVAEGEQAMAAQAYERHSGAASAPLPSSYRRREPERSILYETVRTHWNTLLAEVAQRTDGGSLPGFVVAEFERYLSCGILANGFARVHCDACGKDVLVAFFMSRTRLLPLVHHAPHAGNGDPPCRPRHSLGAGAPVGALAAALGALSARAGPGADHSHARSLPA